MRGCPDCLRGFTTCVPLDNVMADEGFESFVCVGLNDGTDRLEVVDYLTLCVRAGGHLAEASVDDKALEIEWEIDERTFVDRLDLGDQAAVISSALVMDERLSDEIRATGQMIDNFSRLKELRREYDEEDAEATDDSN